MSDSEEEEEDDEERLREEIDVNKMNFDNVTYNSIANH